jgi:uncharacterized membrane protein YoaK (UPF0700 family)
MMKASSNQRQADRGDQLARALLMCGPPQKSVYLSEPPNCSRSIEPGDRVVIEGDSQGQADFLAAAGAIMRDLNPMRSRDDPEGPVRLVSAPSVDNWRAVQVVLILLSVTAGSVDAIGFLGLGGLFIAHITGNLVILAAHLAADDEAPLANIISFPVFIVALAVTRLLAAGLERMHVTSLRPLLLLQFLLLAGFLALCVGGGSRLDLNAANATVAGMLGVSAMAVQNALVQISLKESPSTCVMTTNTTRFVMDLGEVLLGRSRNDGVKAGERAKRTGLAIAGFVVGCGLGAGCQAVTGLWSLALPAGLALVALAIAVAAKLDGSQAQPLIPASSRGSLGSRRPQGDGRARDFAKKPYHP